MANLILQTAKILPKPKRLQSSAGSAVAYDYEPTNPLEQPLGTLLIAAEVLGPTKLAEETIDLLIETMGHSYYANPSDTTVSIGDRFETAIQTLNTKLSSESSEVSTISAVIAIIAGSELHITASGLAAGYLYRKQHTTELTLGMNNPDTTKLFASIASGVVQTGDHVALATPALLHQVSSTELTSIVSNATPPTAVSRIYELLQGQPNVSRTAAIICAVTTPELLAMQTRPDEPAHVTLQTEESLPTAAKNVAIPLARKAAEMVKSTRKQSMDVYRQNIAPASKEAAQKGHGHLRSLLGKLWSSSRGRYAAIAGAMVIVILVGWQLKTQLHNHQVNTLADKYHKAYVLYTQAQKEAAANNPGNARKNLESAQEVTNSLSSSLFIRELNQKLQQSTHESADPANVNTLAASITAQLDKLDQLVRVTPVQVKDFAKEKAPAPARIVVVGSNLIGISENGTVWSANTSTGATQLAAPAPAGIGKVLALAADSDENGVFILTDKPGVWRYSFDDKTVKAVEMSFGAWPKASDIASYNTNLYLLSQTAVTKQTPTLAGFSVPSTSIAFANQPKAGGAVSLAVDGNIYLGGGKTPFLRYTGGAETASIESLPESVKHLDAVVPISEAVAITLDRSSNRLAIIKLQAAKATFDHQITLNNLKLSAIAYDPAHKRVYAITGSQLVQIPLAL